VVVVVGVVELGDEGEDEDSEDNVEHDVEIG